MTLLDCKAQDGGTVRAIGGDRETHRRLVDMGLLDVAYDVKFKRKRSMLVDFRGEFSAVVTSAAAAQIEVNKR